MFLSKIFIRNYKSIAKLDLPLCKGKNVLVGKNNAGKSNIIKAINLVLGESDPTWNKKETISDNDFYKADTSKPIIIFLKIQRESKEDILEELPFLEGLSGGSVWFQGATVPNFRDIDSAFKYSSPAYEPEGCKKIWLGDKSYSKKTYSDYFQNMEYLYVGFYAKYEDGVLCKNISMFVKIKEEDGFQVLVNLGPLRTIFIESAIIPAFRSPQEQLKVSSWSWFGKLVRNHINIQNSDLQNAFAQVKKASNAIFEAMKEDITSGSGVAFPNTSVSFQFNPEMNPNDIAKGILIYVDDGFNSRLEDKGSGIQSFMVISLFDYYIHNVAEVEAGALLALEEPELFLHPHAKRVLSERLNSFLGKKANNQVIVTTHSSDFISANDSDLNIIVVKKEAEKGTTAKRLDANDIKTKQILLRKQNTEMFFSDVVILTEDLKYFIESVAIDLGKSLDISPHWLDENNISVLNCEGKYNFHKYTQILTGLNIKFYIIADFDFLQKGLSEYLTALNAEAKEISELNTLKSTVFIPGTNIKKIAEITTEKSKAKIREYIGKLKKTFNIYIMEGELENLYKEKPRATKEQGVLETLDKALEQNRTIGSFINVTPINDFLKDILTENNIVKDPSGVKEVIPEGPTIQCPVWKKARFIKKKGYPSE